MESTQHHCSDCAYFVQHYIREQNRFIKIYFGHCIRVRTKMAKPDGNACPSFKPRRPGVRNPLLFKEP